MRTIPAVQLCKLDIYGTPACRLHCGICLGGQVTTLHLCLWCVYEYVFTYGLTVLNPFRCFCFLKKIGEAVTMNN